MREELLKISKSIDKKNSKHDYYFSEGDPNISHVSYAAELEKKFEQRYQEEKGIAQDQKNL